MFEGLAEDELTAEEAIRLKCKMCESISCSECKFSRLNNGENLFCNKFLEKYTEQVVEILKQWKKDHEKKEIETEFDRFRENVTLLEKEHTVFSLETLEEKNVIDYYVPYDIQESSKNRPTVTDEFPEGGYLTEGYYECEYELLLTCGEATRRLVIPQRTVNAPMVSLLSNIEDEIIDILDGFPDEDNDFADVLELVDEHYEIKMFDDCGIPVNIEINHAADFVNMIVSARQIKCEFKYGEEQ